MEARPRSCANRCIYCKLVCLVFICISSFQPDSACPSQAGERPGRRSSGGSLLANSSLVSTVTTTSDQSAHPTSSGEDSPAAESISLSSPSSQKATAHGSDVIRKGIQEQRIFGKTCDIICASWRVTTPKQYSTYITRWKLFCAEWKYNPF